MNPEYIEVRAVVRYWEDATVNGTQDDNGTLIPFRDGDCWCPIIRLSDGYVKDWPIGAVADIHYKVCDAGEYWIQDANCERIAKWSGDYVPDHFLCHGAGGWGDYIILRISGNGFVQEWRSPEFEIGSSDIGDDRWLPIHP